MRRVVIILLIIAGVVALLPPFFTHGTCTAEYNAASDAIEHARSRLVTLDSAEAYLRSVALPYSTLTPQRCQYLPPPGVTVCPGGPVLLVEIPVKNRVCRFYRDDSVHVQLGFNAYQQLVHLQTDMSPYHLLKLPFLHLEIDWAK